MGDSPIKDSKWVRQEIPHELDEVCSAAEMHNLCRTGGPMNNFASNFIDAPIRNNTSAALTKPAKKPTEETYSKSSTPAGAYHISSEAIGGGAEIDTWDEEFHPVESKRQKVAIAIEAGRLD